MENEQQKVVQLSGEEFIQVGETVKPFWENGLSESPPKLIIFMGGVGSGKTTIRRQKYSKGYVNFDFGEIYTALKKAVGEDNPKLPDYLAFASDLVLKESLSEKKNIVIEIIGDSKETITPVIDGMRKLGYDVSLEAIYCDVVEAYKRHLKAVEEDKDYLSAYFTQEATLSTFYHQLGLGNMPVPPSATMGPE